jgi:hypothetical protein
VNFYNDLTSITLKIEDVLADENYFTQVPPDWHVIIADIENSTQAIEGGRHDDVNLIAAGSLISVINVTKAHNLEVPYFFGGDGGTVIVPEQLLKKVLAGLNAHRRNSLKTFSLDLKIGSVSIQEITDAGYDLKVAKIGVCKGYNKSVVIGNGLKYAEQLIKSAYSKDEEKLKRELSNDDFSELNLDGLECRWDKIKPPNEEREVVCLLIEAARASEHLQVYRQVLIKLNEIYGKSEKRHPIALNRLQLLASFKKLGKEMRARYSSWNTAHFFKSLYESVAGKFYFKYNLKINNLKGKDYLEQVIAFSDTLTIDGRINTIVSGTKENRMRLLEYLKQQETTGRLFYGHHVSKESIMTCYIENRDSKHIHFIDGSNGGYTEAAKELKPKLKKLQTS